MITSLTIFFFIKTKFLKIKKYYFYKLKGKKERISLILQYFIVKSYIKIGVDYQTICRLNCENLIKIFLKVGPRVSQPQSFN